MSTVVKVFSTLVDAFNGIKLSSGQILHSSTLRTDEPPRLLWRTGGWDTDDWVPPYQYRVTWDIPAELKIQGEPGNALVIQQALDDLYEAAALIYGLPLDESGKVVPFSEHQQELDRKKKLFAIADRFAGPWLKRAVVRPNEADNSFSIADILFHVEFLINGEPKIERSVQVFRLGLMPLAATPYAILESPADGPFTLPLATGSDLTSQGAFARPDPVITIQNRVTGVGFPPVVRGIPEVQGADPATTLRSVDAQPAAATVSTTLQFQAIGTYFDFGTINLTNAATWATTNAAIATVAGGLVTRVATGSCNVTCTFNGYVGTSRITTS